MPTVILHPTRTPDTCITHDGPRAHSWAVFRVASANATAAITSHVASHVASHAVTEFTAERDRSTPMRPAYLVVPART